MLKNIFPKIQSANLVYGISESTNGNMRLKDELSGNLTVKQNRNNIFYELGINYASAVKASLVHGNQVAIVNENNKSSVIENTDGLITKTPGVFLTLTTADCLPIFFYDPTEQACGLVHAGWKGLASDILGSAAAAFVQMGSDPKNILVGIGPGISECHYEIRDDVFSKFSNLKPNEYTRLENSYRLDLKLIALNRLIELDFNKENVEIFSACTYEDDRFFSYRKLNSKDVPINLMMSVIGIKD